MITPSPREAYLERENSILRLRLELLQQKAEQNYTEYLTVDSPKEISAPYYETFKMVATGSINKEKYPQIGRHIKVCSFTDPHSYTVAYFISEAELANGRAPEILNEVLNSLSARIQHDFCNPRDK